MFLIFLLLHQHLIKNVSCHYVAAKTQSFCGFEDDKMCGFTHEESNDFDWVRNVGRTPSSGTGPEVDHTCGEKSSGMASLCLLTDLNSYLNLALWIHIFTIAVYEVLYISQSRFE